ncbi:MAG: Gfo/Idh/MocA family oxidoreductase [Hydrogenovibrio crunogenus]|nr:Gfo/Idh/MocA family oxidoreductase [Hydrogenovibrio crunogenus]
MSKVIKIGVLGCANIAERFVIPAIKHSSKFEFIGIASRSKEKANKFADKFNTKAFYSYQSLIESDVEAIYIPLPNSMHYEWIKKSLDEKLHVLVEKSLACDLEHVKELNELARNNKLVLIENFQFRFHSQLEFIKNLIDRDCVGELRLVRSSFGFPAFKDKENIRYQKTLGGGALLDVGAYPLKITQLFLGEDVFVDTSSLTTPQTEEVDIWGSACIKQKKGSLTSQIAFGFDHFYQNTLEIWGNKGRLQAHRVFTAGPGVEPKVTLETNEGTKTYSLPEDNHFINMLHHFHGLVTTGNGLDVEYKQNINQARLLSELYEKSK